jgi:Rrf2 family transcriptional regulator, iron-sulfur cluster assembly transcription factor
MAANASATRFERLRPQNALQEFVALELNTRGRYAVMAMADIAKFAPAMLAPSGVQADAVSLSVIAERQHLSVAYLEQLFVALRRAELVESVRGRSGGYRLARPAAAINIAEIMAAVEEDIRMTRCHDEPGGCVGSERCLTHGLWDALGRHIQGFLASITLQDVLDGIPPSFLDLAGKGPVASRPAAPREVSP